MSKSVITNRYIIGYVRKYVLIWMLIRYKIPNH